MDLLHVIEPHLGEVRQRTGEETIWASREADGQQHCRRDTEGGRRKSQAPCVSVGKSRIARHLGIRQQSHARETCGPLPQLNDESLVSGLSVCQNRRHPGRSFLFFLFLSTLRSWFFPALPCLFFRISYNMGKDHVETLVLRCAGDLIERTLIPSAAAAAAPISLLPE